MTAVESTTAAAPAGITAQQLALLFQYTVEAYKTFEKLAENLPNPMTRTMFKQFAVDERENRDLVEMKIAATGPSHGNARVRVTLGSDMIFNDILEGELSYREAAEFLIARERTMQRKLREFIGSSTAVDRNLLIYFETVKRAHIVELERELELIRFDNDWWKREDAEWRIVHGSQNP
jgi:rubrerythrin